MPATITAIINQKGGTGKTCTCASLGIGLAREGKNVLLVDIDPQSSLTISLGYDKPDDLPVTVATLMMKVMNGEAIAQGEGILHHREIVALLPSCIELSGVEAAAVNALSRENILKQILTPLRKQYDHILIDCSPSLSMLNLNALSAADNVIIPVQPQYLSAKGLVDLLNTINKVKRQINPKLRTEGIVMTMIYYGGELISSMTTNEDGVALSEALHKGEYMVCERDNPTGYTGDLIVLDAVVKSDETTHLSCTNQPIQGRIQIMKRDQLTKETLAGAEFTVTRIAGLPSHNGSDDGEVVAVITPMLTWGTYHIEETKVPEHYVDNSFSAEVTISEDQKMPVRFVHR